MTAHVAGVVRGDVSRGACPGYPLSEDLNGFQQEGVGKMDSTVHRGMRWSAASAYLRPALARKVGVLVSLTFKYTQPTYIAELVNHEQRYGHKSHLRRKESCRS